MFSEDDTNGAFALLAYEDSLCAGCGHPAEESMSRDAEGTYTAHLRICHACAEIDRFKNRLADQSVEPGARISVTKS